MPGDMSFREPQVHFAPDRDEHFITLPTASVLDPTEDAIYILIIDGYAIND